jgi:hypothetical protein
MSCLILANGSVFAQKNGGQNPSSSQTPSPSPSAASPANASGGAPGSASLQGVSFSRETWSQISILPPPETFGLKNDDVSSFMDDLQGHSFRKDVLVYCYTLRQNLSAGMPFVLEPTPATEDTSKYELCTNQIQTRHRGVSLIMGRYLVVRIDMQGIPQEVRDRIQTLNLNVTSAAGTPVNSLRGSSLNPSLARPRMALLSGRPFPCAADHPYTLDVYKLAGRPLRDAFCPGGDNPFVDNPSVVYLVWPGPLVADSLATISVNLIYTPVAPSLPWKPNTFYPAGSVVISSADGPPNGHYYQALTGGTSAPAAPPFDVGLVSVQEFHDGGPGLAWQKIGPVCEQGPPAAGAAAPAPPIAGLDVYKIKTEYSTGDLVMPPAPGNCHFYSAIVKAPSTKVLSADTPPAFTVSPTKPIPDANADGPLSWQDMGAISVPAWAPGIAYAEGAFVTASPSNGYFYQATVAGVSGAFQPAFPIEDGGTVTESARLIWLDAGPGATQPSSIKVLKKWTASTPYILGDGVLDNATGHYYVAIQPGVSGVAPPQFAAPGPPLALPAPQIVPDSPPLQWQDIGTTPPASASLGTQPADLTVNVLNLTLPQVHSLTWFNLASGVVVSSLRPTSVTTYAGVGPGSQSNANADDVCPVGVSSCTLYTTSKGSHLIDPVVGLTVYALHPLDVERPFRMQDLTPAPTFDLSVLSPTTNFHIGFSSEFFVRNLQLNYGGSFVQETRVPPGTPTATIDNQPAYLSTVKKFNKGGFFGFTLNISGLINAATGLIP